MAPQRTVYVREQPRSREERDDLRLEWRWHIPFTSKKKEKKYILVEERPAPIFVQRAPPSPPPTPIYRTQPANIVPISPLLPVREHRNLPAPARERSPAILLAPAREQSPDRLHRLRQDAIRNLAARQAALDARIDELRAQQAAREAEREEARRTRAHEARLREINDEIARLEAELRRSERRRRAADGNIIHQGPVQERRRHEDNVREHRGDFQLPHRDAGGGIRAGDAGLGGGRHARQRAEDREIRRLERRFDEERRRRRREALPGDPNAGRRPDHLPRQPWNEAAGIRINNRNGRARM